MKEIHKTEMSKNMVMVTDANGHPTTSSNITTTELNMLNNIRTNVQTQLDALSGKCCMPDFAAGVSITSGSVVPCAALGVVSAGSSGGGQVSAAINGITVWSHKCGDGGGAYAIGSFLIPAGSTVTFSGTLTYYPLKWMVMSAS